MKPSLSTLNLMRQPLSAAVAVIALSGTVSADVTIPDSEKPKEHSTAASDVEKKEEPKKEDAPKKEEEPKKEEPAKEDPCPPCGLG